MNIRPEMENHFETQNDGSDDRQEDEGYLSMTRGVDGRQEVVFRRNWTKGL